MKSVACTALCLVLLSGGAAWGKDLQTRNEVHGTPVEKSEVQNTVRTFSLEETQALGRAMYLQDQAAAAATDILLAQVPDLSAYPVEGWVVSMEGGCHVVTFVGTHQGELRAMFAVRPEAPAARRLSDLGYRPLTEEEEGQFKARKTTLGLINQWCSDSYNSIILPAPDGNAQLIYWMAATSEPDVALVGGHYRFTTSSDWQRVEREEQLFSSCLRLGTKGMPENAALFAAQPLSEAPLETHVFLQLQLKKTFVVQTGNDALWEISDGMISPMK